MFYLGVWILSHFSKRESLSHLLRHFDHAFQQDLLQEVEQLVIWLGQDVTLFVRKVIGPILALRVMEYKPCVSYCLTHCSWITCWRLGASSYSSYSPVGQSNAV